MTVNVSGGMGRNGRTNAPGYSGLDGTVIWGQLKGPGTVVQVR